MRTRPGPIRVLHVLTSLEIGGAEMVAVSLIGAMDPTRFESRVVCLRREGPLAATLRSTGVAVDCLQVGGGALALAGSLRRAVRRFEPDVVHSHNVSPFIAAGLALTGVAHIRLVHTKHGRATASGAFGRIALRLAAHRAAAIAAVSADAAKMAVEEEGFPSARVGVVFNGVNPGRAPARRPNQWRAVTVARLEAVKDQATMVAAVRHIVTAEPRFHLDIVGDGAERHNLEALVRDHGIESHVTFHGFRDDVRDWLDRADVFLLSSLSEGISLTLLEAMAAGLPVVATAVGGNGEVVAAGSSGVLVPPRDPVAFADAVIGLLGDPARLESFGAAGRVRVEQVFGIDAMIAAYSAMYTGTAD